MTLDDLSIPQRLMLADAVTDGKVRPDGGGQTRTAMSLERKGLVEWTDILHIRPTEKGRALVR